MTRPTLCVIDPVKPAGQTYANPILSAARPQFEPFLEMRPRLDDLAGLYDRADALWIDWATEHAVLASQLNAGHRKPLWIHLHAFEVLEGRFCRDIAWSNVSGLVAVSRDVLRLAEEQAPNLNDTRRHVISNGVDCSRFYPTGMNDPYHLSWVGEITPKKNPHIVVHLLHALRQNGAPYRLSMAGAFVSDRSLQHVRHLVQQFGLEAVVSINGHVADMASWFRDKGVLVSTSLYESFGLAIGEAAASGAAPVIFDFPNATDLWPREWIVSGFLEACEAVLRARPGAARAYVLARYSLDRMEDGIRRVLSGEA